MYGGLDPLFRQTFLGVFVAVHLTNVILELNLLSGAIMKTKGGGQILVIGCEVLLLGTKDRAERNILDSGGGLGVHGMVVIEVLSWLQRVSTVSGILMISHAAKDLGDKLEGIVRGGFGTTAQQGRM